MASCPYCRAAVSPGDERCPACGAWLLGLDTSEPGAGSSEEDLSQRVLAELRDRGKIAAVKLYRETTGCGLKEAKEAVEALEAGKALELPAELGEVNLDEVLSLIQSNQKIAAIKAYREQTGVGLKEAKEAVEALAALGAQSAAPDPAGPNLDEVLALLRAGKKIAAIKVYRGLTGVGLAEAKDAVENLERRHR